MRYFMIATAFLCACGSSDKQPPDIAVAVEVDLAAPDDLTVLASIDAALPDFAFSSCTPPHVGIYNETVQYSYVPAAGGPSTFASSGSIVAIKNDGSYTRPSAVFTSPDRYHCLFTSVDALTCLTACCPGQASSPTMYVDNGGWALWTGGACAFQTTTGAQFIANIADVEAYFTR